MRIVDLALLALVAPQLATSFAPRAWSAPPWSRIHPVVIRGGSVDGGDQLSREALSEQSVKELKALAAQKDLSLADCFEKADIVEKLFASCASGGGSGGDAVRSSTGSATEEGGVAASSPAPVPVVTDELRELSVRQLKTMIFTAGLSSKGLMEKAELLERAAEAKVILDSRPKNPDAEAYKELEVVLFARQTCPYCVYAKDGLQERGLLPNGWEDEGLLDVERSQVAAQEFQSLGGEGVPMFFSRKTKKTVRWVLPSIERLPGPLIRFGKR